MADLHRQQVQHGHSELVVSTLGTLAAITVSLSIDAARGNGVILKQLKAGITYSGKISAEGPIVIGLSTDLSAAEVAEAMVADPQSQRDIPATEQANRRVYPLFVIGVGQTSSGDSGDQMTPYRKIRFPWKDFSEGKGLQLFAWNADSSNLTGSMLVEINWVAVQEWLDD